MLSAEEQLDQALEGTFPASDAFCLVPDQVPARENHEPTLAEKRRVPGDRAS